MAGRKLVSLVAPQQELWARGEIAASEEQSPPVYSPCDMSWGTGYAKKAPLAVGAKAGREKTEAEEVEVFDGAGEGLSLCLFVLLSVVSLPPTERRRYGHLSMPERRQTFLNVVLQSPRVAAAWSRGRWVMLSRTARGTCVFARELAGTGEDSASSYEPSSAGCACTRSWSAEVSAWRTPQGFSTVSEKFWGEEGVAGCIIIIS